VPIRTPLSGGCPTWATRWSSSPYGRARVLPAVEGGGHPLDAPARSSKRPPRRPSETQQRPPRPRRKKDMGPPSRRAPARAGRQPARAPEVDTRPRDRPPCTTTRTSAHRRPDQRPGDDMIRGFIADQRTRCSTRARRAPPRGRLRPARRPRARRGLTFSKSIADLHDKQRDRRSRRQVGRPFGFDRTWPFAIVDEAYQMRSDSLLPIGVMMDSLLMVVTPVSWPPSPPQTTPDSASAALAGPRPRPDDPHHAAGDRALLPWPISWRLPSHAASPGL